MGTLDQGLQTQAKIPGFTPNLFEVSIFGEDTTNPDTNSPFFTDFFTGGKQGSVFYCTAYELPPPALGLKRDPLSKKFYVNKYNIPETVSITWQENTRLEVWKYHNRWLRCFYNRETDKFVTAAKGKKRNAYIVIQNYVAYYDPSSGQQTAIPFDPSLRETFTIKLVGLVPQSIPSLKGDWNQDASNSMGLVIKYYVDYIVITKSDGFEEAQ